MYPFTQQSIYVIIIAALSDVKFAWCVSVALDVSVLLVGLPKVDEQVDIK